MEPRCHRFPSGTQTPTSVASLSEGAETLSDHISRQRETHRLRHIISKLAKHLPAEARAIPEVREMVAYGCTTTMHVVQLLAPRLDKEDHMKEMDFSPAGYPGALARATRTREFSTIEGVILHPLDTPNPEEPANETIADAAG